VGSIGAVVESVAAGLGLAMVSVEAAREHLTIGRVKVIEFPIRFKRPLYRIHFRYRPTSPAAQAFIALADEAGLPVSD
jgi:DNA-binding transcriptional LysR family regulator